MSAQLDALKRAGATTIFREKVSATRGDRPQFAKLLATVKAGDTLIVCRLDRLARSLRELLVTLDHFGKAGVVFKSLGDPLFDTSTAQGRLLLAVLGAVAEFEASLIYQVIQPKTFSDLFSTLGISANHVEDAVKHPDDHQHLMTEGLPEDAKTLSLFMKQVVSRGDSHNRWLLVQTNRIGLQQHVQAAWIIFPSDVDLSMASAPIDALRAFVDVFGCPISVGDKKAIIVDPQQFPYDASVRIDWTGAPREHFVNFSQTTNVDTRLFKVGLAYCIDIPKYRASLKRHGIRVREPTQSMVFA